MCPALCTLLPEQRGFYLTSNLKLHNITVFDNVFLSFRAEESLFAGAAEGADGEEFLPFNHLGADEASAKVSVNGRARLRRSGTPLNCPTASFVLAGCKESNQVQNFVTLFYQVVQTLLKNRVNFYIRTRNFGQNLLAVFVGFRRIQDIQ